MKTIEATLSQLTDLSIVENLRKILRKKDQAFLPVEAKFQEAIPDQAQKLGLDHIFAAGKNERGMDNSP